MLDKPLWIKCNACQLKSYNANDIAHKFCGQCNKFHDGGEFELGPTPTSLSKAFFSWTDPEGRSWGCSRPEAEHSPQWRCSMCTQIWDDPIRERPMPRITHPMRLPEPRGELHATGRSNTTLKSYRHYKGGTYTLLMIGRNSEDSDELVAIYVSHATQQVWIRPWEIFVELVIWPDGVIRPRFTEWNPDDDCATK